MLRRSVGPVLGFVHSSSNPQRALQLYSEPPWAGCLRIHWHAPQGYSLADAELQASSRGLGSVLAPLTGFSFTSTTTGSAATGYVTDVPVNLLGGLLGLGSELQLTIVVKRYGWTSNGASVATNAGLVAGLGSSCRNLPPAG